MTAPRSYQFWRDKIIGLKPGKLIRGVLGAQRASLYTLARRYGVPISFTAEKNGTYTLSVRRGFTMQQDGSYMLTLRRGSSE